MTYYRIEEERYPIRELQRYLLGLSYRHSAIPPLSIDGIYGEETREAVIAFQAYARLPETGVVNYTTWTALYAAYLASIPTRPPLLPLPDFPINSGSEGHSVTVLQSFLNRLATFLTSLPPTPITGQYTRTTSENVKRLQKRYGMTADGEVTAELWKRITDDEKALRTTEEQAAVPAPPASDHSP